MSEIYCMIAPPILRPPHRPMLPASPDASSDCLILPLLHCYSQSCRDYVNSHLSSLANCHDRCGNGDLPFWSSTTSRVKQSTAQRFMVRGSRNLQVLERDRGVLWRGEAGKESQAWSLAGNLQAPVALFRFPAPSSSQTERKRENNFRAPLFTPISLIWRAETCSWKPSAGPQCELAFF